jgi:hypothetical protein
MKNNKSAGKLALNKETVSNLVITEMEQVNGGVKTLIPLTYISTCDPTYCGNLCP